MQAPEQVHPKEGGAQAAPFKFSLNQALAVAVSGEQGPCIARSEHATSEPQYLLRYKAADGRAVEAWWGESALVVPAVSRQPGSPARQMINLIDAVLGAKVEPAAHPSRSAPRCKDCQFFLKDIMTRYCQHPSAPVWPATGYPALDIDRARLEKGKCGPAGLLFMPAAANPAA